MPPLDLTVREELVALSWHASSMDSPREGIFKRPCSNCVTSMPEELRESREGFSGPSSTLLRRDISARDSNGKVSRIVSLSQKSGGLSLVSPLPRPISILYFHGDHSAELTARLSDDAFPQGRQNGFTWCLHRSSIGLFAGNHVGVTGLRSGSMVKRRGGR